MITNQQDKPKHLVVILFALLGWVAVTNAYASNSNVGVFLQSVKAKAPTVAVILNDYRSRITTTCGISPTVDDLKRFGQHSPVYVDLLAYKTLAPNEIAYQNTLQRIDCSLFEMLRHFPVKSLSN
ncbi:MAG: hypothetical protein AMJ53_01275 [Gammaproteobacteria bacterium SG8_11]|nr:MAG: hypothetical protein AMJ53_01275 [Gammaproteobacteria bacterium SG8_11]